MLVLVNGTDNNAAIGDHEWSDHSWYGIPYALLEWLEKIAFPQPL